LAALSFFLFVLYSSDAPDYVDYDASALFKYYYSADFLTRYMMKIIKRINRTESGKTIPRINVKLTPLEF
jgi:hypothetical protein